MSVSKKWRNIAAGLFLSIATVGAVSTVASTPSQAADVRFGIMVGDHDRDYRHDRYWAYRREAAWRHEQYLRARERERAHERHEAWRQHERWEHRHDGW